MTGRLSTMAAALVVARRDFSAILFSRSFIFFLLGPLFPILVGALAGGVGQRVQDSVDRAELGLAMAADDVAVMLAAHEALAPRLGQALPRLAVVRELAPGEPFDPAATMAARRGNYAAILSGTPENPVLTGTPGSIRQWQGPVSMLAAQSLGNAPAQYPVVALAPVASANAAEKRSNLMTAQAAQTLLFLLTMLLAGMVLSNLVEEKANKIIEILAAAIPMEAVFFGKLFAMLAVSLVGIAVWGLAVFGVTLVTGPLLPDLAEPAVGWSLFVALGIAYFAMAYLLLGSIFLAIGSLAATVREVQTLSMPVTMLQLVVFFFASFAMTQPGTSLELASVAIPFSSPFAMIARAAQDGALWTHGVVLVWQALWLVIFVRIGARLFRSRVMKSGPAAPRARRRLFRRPASA